MGLVFTAYDPDLDRKVAIKLLKPEPRGPLAPAVARARMLREAQAMARVSHPNVVGVHEVGTFEERVFLVMELVEGMTLTDWLGERTRSWTEVARVFTAAGRGLAAAHAAGLVHRDFKPDNVLIGSDDRVRVTDFGLVGRSESAAAPGEEVSAMGGDSSARGEVELAATVDGEPNIETSPELALQITLTRTGALVGTPRYMAPEQLTCQPVDGRTDQFSYCVALYEALYGQRPFDGKTLRELIKNVMEGVPRELGKDAVVPAWLQRIVLRGLATSPDGRYSSMESLLADLDRDLGGTKRRWLVAAAVVAALGLLGFGYALVVQSGAERSRRPLCAGAAEKLSGIWDGQVKSGLRAAFANAGVAYAADASRRVEAVVDDYTAGWITMRRQACESTHVRGEQSAELLDLRMGCLDRRAAELHALVSALTEADDATIEIAVQAAYGLTPLTVCADVDALTAPTPRPAEAGRRARLEELEKQLAEAGAQQALGKFPEVIAICARLLEPARELGHRPFLAELLLRLGSAQAQTGEAAAAAATLLEATEEAEAARADSIAAEAWVQVVFVVGFLQRNYDHAAMWQRRANAAIQRLAGETSVVSASIEELRGRLLLNVGAVRYSEGKFSEARDDWEQTLVLWTRALGKEHPDLIRVLNNLAAVTDRLGDWERSAACSEQALAIAEKTIGSDHPHYGTALDSLAATLRMQGKHEESLLLFKRALAVRRQTLGDGHPDVAKTLHNMGNTLLPMGRLDEALDVYRQALAIHERAGGVENDNVAISLVSIGSVLNALGRPAEAIASHERALEILVRVLSPDHAWTAYPHVGLGEAYITTASFGKALAHHRRALGIWEKSLGKDNRQLAHALTGIGLAELGLGAPARALAPLQRALVLREVEPTQSGELAQTKFALARALWLTRRDRPRSLQLAEQARAGFAANGASSRAELAAVAEWLGEHVPRP